MFHLKLFRDKVKIFLNNGVVFCVVFSLQNYNVICKPLNTKIRKMLVISTNKKSPYKNK